jgi:chloramphenicol-sensitive protein RarD
MAFRRQIGEYLAALKDWRVLRMLLISAVLIALNWLVYIYSIFTDHVLAASLGYYLNPLVNVMLGMIFLGERLSRLQAVAVVIAGIGVAILLAGALDTLWISLTLAFSFGTYGLIRKDRAGRIAARTRDRNDAAAAVGGAIAGFYIWLGDGRGFGSEGDQLAARGGRDRDRGAAAALCHGGAADELCGAGVRPISRAEHRLPAQPVRVPSR